MRPSRASRWMAAVSLLLLLAACSRGPRVPEGASRLAAEYLTAEGFRWRTAERPGFRLHVQPGSYAAARVDSLAAQLAEARERALRLLQERDDARVLDVFFVHGREEMRRLTGLFVRGGTTFPDEGVVVLAASPEWRAHARHEVMHAVSLSRWGRPSAGDWVHEGVAVLAEDACGPYALDAVAAHLVRTGAALPPDALTEHFREQDDLTAYLQAGSLLGHVHARHGAGGVRALWMGGVDGLERSAGRSLAALDAEWREAMMRRPAEAVDWEALRTHGCGWRGAPADAYYPPPASADPGTGKG